MSDNRAQKGDNGFVVQAGILAVAGIITRVIGLLYRSPLNSVILPLGLGYYQSAYNYYTIILLISSYSIPSAMSKVVAQKLGAHEYRNAHRLFKGALVYVLVVGAAASLFLYFGAGLFVSDEAVPVLRTFAPTIFIYGILGVLRGYFQAHKSMVQTSVSQILEQIANAAVSIGGAYLLIKIGMGSMAVPADTDGKVARATYGAIGSAVGTGVGVLTALIFMALIYRLNRPVIRRRIERDRHTQVDSYGTVLRTITTVVTPFILSTAVYNLSSTVNNNLYTKWYPTLKNLDSVEIHSNYGLFSGQALTISNIPIAFASAMAAAMIPTIAQLIAAGRVEDARGKIAVAIRTTMVISIPCAVGLFVLAEPVTALLFASDTADELALAAQMLRVLAVSVVFYALSTLNSNILQGLGKLNAPIVNAALALAVQTGIAAGLLFLTDCGLYSIAIANTVYAGLMYLLNHHSVSRAVGYRQELRRTFGIPLLASVCMGAAAWGVYTGLYALIGSRILAVLPAIALAVVVYFALILLLKGVTEEELRGFPKGYLLVRLARKCRLLR